MTEEIGKVLVVLALIGAAGYLTDCLSPDGKTREAVRWVLGLMTAAALLSPLAGLIREIGSLSPEQWALAAESTGGTEEARREYRLFLAARELEAQLCREFRLPSGAVRVTFVPAASGDGASSETCPPEADDFVPLRSAILVCSGVDPIVREAVFARAEELLGCPVLWEDEPAGESGGQMITGMTKGV